MNDVIIIDTTLRDGEQTAGIAFTGAEKTTIARLLDKAGVREIEAGIPVMGGEETRTIRGIINLGLRANIITWNRLNLDDIKASLNCGAKFVHISAPVSDLQIRFKLRRNRDWIIENLKRAIWFSKEKGCRVSVGAEDASRADSGFLTRFASVAGQEGAERLRFADTLGVLDPFSACEKIKAVCQAVDIAIEMHAHNDFGMATANTLAAIKGGAGFVSTTVNGIGERAGNACMEEVVGALESLFGHSTGLDRNVFASLSEFVAKASNRRLTVRRAGTL